MPRTTAWIFVLVLFLPGAPALSRTRASLLIDFETFPGPDGLLGTADDEPAPPCPLAICRSLSTEYASLGLVFTSGALGQADLFPGTGAANHFVTGSPLDVTLSKDTFFVSIDSYSAWTAVLRAFDARGQLIGTRTGPGVGTLFLTSDRPIRRFTVRAQDCSPEGPCPQILNLGQSQAFPGRSGAAGRRLARLAGSSRLPIQGADHQRAGSDRAHAAGEPLQRGNRVRQRRHSRTDRGAAPRRGPEAERLSLAGSCQALPLTGRGLDRAEIDRLHQLLRPTRRQPRS
jgi:hypothetical protein